MFYYDKSRGQFIDLRNFSRVSISEDEIIFKFNYWIFVKISKEKYTAVKKWLQTMNINKSTTRK